jgi:putative redox protein
MEIKVSHLGNVQFKIQARAHSILCDQPAENNGDDTGMTPPELLLAALGSCAAYYAVEYLKTRKLADSGVEVSVTADKVKPPARLDNFHIRIACPVALTEDQIAGLTRSVKHCLVHNTLLNTPSIELELDLPHD